MKKESLMINKIKRSTMYNKIKTSLKLQLEVENDVLLDLIDDYMSFYITKTLLIMDIEERGVQTITYNSRGDEIYKKNDSITELTKVNTQMLKILAQLNIKNEIKEDSLYDEL
ncbi:MAG: hypothetical protein IKS59_05070 [Aeriscardovia sp.]|nr:hypothetical protein [Aeriscardovia sp.]